MTSSLTIFTRAAAMLAEADTIQKAKELKDLALTAKDWARRKGMGEEAIQHARSYAFEAERKMGQMLSVMPKNKGAIRGKTGIQGKPLPDKLPTLQSFGLNKLSSSKAQALAALPVEVFEKVKAGILSRNGKSVHVSHNSGENEWYTPSEFVEAARAAMGGIDCDPASSAIANKTVKARKFFDKECDGLKQAWTGRVFLNPPYAQPLVAQFANAVADKFNLGEIEHACVLVNNATETAWFVKIAQVASAICFPTTRVRFLDPTGAAAGAPLQGQAVLYLGRRRAAFCAAFKPFGICVHVV